MLKKKYGEVMLNLKDELPKHVFCMFRLVFLISIHRQWLIRQFGVENLRLTKLSSYTTVASRYPNDWWERPAKIREVLCGTVGFDSWSRP